MKKPIAIFLTFLVLFGHVSLSYGKHFCGGLEVKAEWMIGHEHLDCGMGMMETPTHSSEHHATLKAPPCCENVYSSSPTQAPAILQSSDVASAQITFVPAAVLPIFHTSLRSKELTHHRLTRPPPLPGSQLRAFLQNYLI